MLNLFLIQVIGAIDTLEKAGNEELNSAVVSIETTTHSNELPTSHCTSLIHWTAVSVRNEFLQTKPFKMYRFMDREIFYCFSLCFSFLNVSLQK